MSQEYEKLDLKLQYPIEADLINGSGLFSYASDECVSILLRVTFEQLHDELIAHKFHHELATQLSFLCDTRKESNVGCYGGGRVKIQAGEVYVVWMTQQQADELLDMDYYQKLPAQLAEKYAEILTGADLKEIYNQTPDLSGVFLASPSAEYGQSKIKTMIIGQETRSWRNESCAFKALEVFGHAQVLESMQETVSFNENKANKSKFRQFYLSTSKELCGDERAAVWSNLFCVSYNKGSPIKSPKFEAIQKLSAALLKAQFELLSPDVAIFVTGSSRDRFIKQAFEGQISESTVIVPRRLWHFKIGNTHCFRTNHPRWGGSQEYLKAAIEKAKNCTEG